MASGSEAPGALETLRMFVNTRDIESATDELATPAALGAWFVERGLLDAGAVPTSRDHEQAIAAREALRALLVANGGGPAAPESFDVLNAAAERAELGAQFGPAGADPFVPRAGGPAGALGRILGIAHAAMADGTWSRLKACPDETCRWAFYDHSRNGSGRWCSMAVCGNRNKGQAFRARRKATEPG